MLAVTTYHQEYIDACRTLLENQLVAYQAVAAEAGGEDRALALDPFEPVFSNHLVLALDRYFVHRTRAIEGKDGNPLNEVRMLSESILHNAAVLSADKTIKYQPETSVLKLRVGDEIRLDGTQFDALHKAFFAELQERFG